MAALASAVDVLALTNYVKGERLYDWFYLSFDGKPVSAMNGFHTLVDHPVRTASRLDAVVFCCGVGGSRYTPPGPLVTWTREQYARGTRVGAISTGAWGLARMNLLVNRRFTVHWEDREAFCETFPTLVPSREIFEIDGRIFSCSGGAASMDMFLSFVADTHGAATANAVSEQLVHGSIRPDQANQRSDLKERLGTTNQGVIEVVTLMEANIESPLSQREIASRVSLSTRQVERLFRDHLGCTPQRYYRTLRLELVQRLLWSTSLAVREIALATGFCNASYLASCYHRHFGRLPGSERSNARGRDDRLTSLAG